MLTEESGNDALQHPKRHLDLTTDAVAQINMLLLAGFKVTDINVDRSARHARVAVLFELPSEKALL